MARTEFHGEDDGSRRSIDVEMDFFSRRLVKVEGSFTKFEVQVEVDANHLSLTTARGKEFMSSETAQALILALQDAIDYLEDHPRRHSTGVEYFGTT